MKCKVYSKRDLLEKRCQLAPGDFILTHGDSVFDKLIQIFTMSDWNHCALIIDSKGEIVELVDRGIKKHNIEKKY